MSSKRSGGKEDERCEGGEVGRKRGGMEEQERWRKKMVNGSQCKKRFNSEVRLRGISKLKELVKFKLAFLSYSNCAQLELAFFFLTLTVHS
jgi:hypothetical protein